ncbi:hypothetical protein [Achromobacter phage tuull]|nr:hypothetical protein [Achromobacter phage tuull]
MLILGSLLPCSRTTSFPAQPSTTLSLLPQTSLAILRGLLRYRILAFKSTMLALTCICPVARTA